MKRLKMRLAAKAPNEGARLCAQWIMRECQGCLLVAASRFRTTVTTIERLIAGEITPGEELVAPVAQVTRDRVKRRDWQRPACGGWFDVPAEQVAA